MKPPLTYYGGKQKLVREILPLIPKHKIYCEPFFGGGAIFFAKEPTPIEVINDTNGDLINFYQVIKNDFKKLKREIKTTLHSRQFHKEAKIILQNPTLFDEVKRAWSVWVLAHQSFASMLDSIWVFDKKHNTTPRRIHNKRIAFAEGYAKRLERTEIECTDALEVIRTRDAKDTFFYLDPPYFNSDCGHYKKYREKDFKKLLDKLSQIKGKFLLSSYPSDLLKQYIRKNKWFTKVVDKPLCVSSICSIPQRKKQEVLTGNYETRMK
ncbi:MAG: DNA adenine methylase [Bacteroidetes bacterium]|nr:DNA adenine methylase [Bacteroidota bacterium]